RPRMDCRSEDTYERLFRVPTREPSRSFYRDNGNRSAPECISCGAEQLAHPFTTPSVNSSVAEWSGTPMRCCVFVFEVVVKTHYCGTGNIVPAAAERNPNSGPPDPAARHLLHRPKWY